MVAFHRFLIATAILFCAGFGIWSLSGGGASGGAAKTALGISFLVIAGVLTYYLKNLNRFLHR